MNANDLMKSIILLVTDADKEETGQMSPLSQAATDAEPNREKQIVDLLPDHDHSEWANEPEEKYATIDAVTVDAGGGVNGPKHPSDMRVQHPSLYPTAQSEEEQPKRVSIHDALMQMLGGR
jgi:hypothetical protein